MAAAAPQTIPPIMLPITPPMPGENKFPMKAPRAAPETFPKCAAAFEAKLAFIFVSN
jgi:hypothetical protein